MSGQFLTPAAWRGYRRADFPAASWRIEGDVLHAVTAAQSVDLVSRQIFGDFELSLEWRLPVAGNSGVLYRVTERLASAWQSGPELQLLDDERHPDGRVPETSCGALYGLQAPGGAPTCPPGLFNVAGISLRGMRVAHWLNGVRVIDCDLASEAFRTRVRDSKFGGLPHFARATDGHLVLQHHGTEAWFRNIRIDS